MTLTRALAGAALTFGLATPLLLSGCRESGPDDRPATCQGEDAFAPNSSRDTAHVLDPSSFDADGSFAEQQLMLCRGDEDWFRVDVSAGQMLEVFLDFAQAAGDLQLELLSSTGATVVASASVTDGEHLRHTFLKEGSYYLRIYGETPVVGNTYDLSVDLLGEPCALDAFEPNEGAVGAAALAPGSYTDLTVCFGEDDWYELDAADGQVVVATASFDHDSAELSMSLYRQVQDGTNVWQAGSGANDTGAQLVHRVIGEGPFFLQVVRGAETINASYDLDLDINGVACAPDPHEPNDGYYEASPVQSGDRFTDMSLCVGDHDWYSIEVEPGEMISARIDFSHAEGDLALQIYRLEDDGTVSIRSSANTLTDNETLNYRPFDSGTFLVHVSPTRGSVMGTYDFSVDLIGDPCLGDDYEPNNAQSEAAPLAQGQHGDMTLCVGDDDWYEIEVGNSQLIDVSILFDHAENDLALTIYKRNDDGTVTARTTSNTLTDNEALVYRPFDEGTFLIRVYRTRGTQLASYAMNLAITGEACVPDAHEPNDAYPQARPIALGQHPGQSLCVGDSDWYSVEARNGQLLKVDLGFTHADNDLGVRIYKLNPDGTVALRVTADTLTDNESLGYRPYDDGTFLIHVYRTRGTEVASYDLSVDVVGSPCAPDAYEPNDSWLQARAITSGISEDMSLCVGDADWFKIDLVNGQLLTARIGFTHADNDLGLTIYKLESDGTVSSRASSNTLTDDETIAYRPYDSGTFLVYVFRTRGTEVASYDLSVTVSGTPCVDDAYEPNQSWTEAPTIDPATDDFSDLSLCVGDDDWWRLSLINGQLFEAYVSFNHAANDLAVILYKLNDDGTISGRVSADSLTNDEWLVYRPYETGEFVLRVYRSRGTAVATYAMDLKVEGDGCSPDAFEPNDHWLQATPFTPGTPQPGLTSCVGDDDWYSLGSTLQAGDRVQARAAFTHADNDFGMALYRVEASGALTTRIVRDSLDDDEQFDFTVASVDVGSELVLRVYRSRGTTHGTYDLTIDVD